MCRSGCAPRPQGRVVDKENGGKADALNAAGGSSSAQASRRTIPLPNVVVSAW